MQRVIFCLVCILCSTPVFSQILYDGLLEQINFWNMCKIDSVLNEKLLNIPSDETKKRDIPRVDYAKKHYEEMLVFQSEISYNDSVINISIANNDFPLDLYYIDDARDRSDVKLMILTYKGKVEIITDGFRALMIGLAKKQANAFRYIYNQRPDLIFVCPELFGCYFYVKNKMVYVYDYYHQEKWPLDDYDRFNELITDEEVGIFAGWNCLPYEE